MILDIVIALIIFELGLPIGIILLAAMVQTLNFIIGVKK